jgi:glycosyltransferase involved in cell wall biosynthesis
MKLGFDAKRYVFNKTGLGNYSRTWINALASLNNPPEIVLFSHKKPCENLELPLFHGGSFFYRSFGMGKDAVRNGCDIFHGLSNEIPMDKPKIPMVCTIHDVIFKEFPQFYPRIDRNIYHLKTKYACRYSDRIIVTSETTKEQLLRFYNVDSRKIHVIYQTIHPRFQNLKWNPDTEKRYVLYHSSFNYRKNQIELVKAFNKVVDLCDFNLVLAGSGSLYHETEQVIKALNLTHRVQIILSPTEVQLDALLIHASGFIYPSLQEGFGIPLVEAASLGMPIMASDISIFRELLGNECVAYFNPYSIDSMSFEMLNFNAIFNSNSRPIKYETLLHKTSQETMTKEAMNVYHSLA